MSRDKKITFLILFVTVSLFGTLIGYSIYTAKKETEKITLLQTYCPEGVLLFGGDEDSAPMRFLDADGVYRGFTVDYLTLMSLELGIQINMQHYAKWSDALEACRTGETDLCDIYESPARRKLYALSEPLYTMRAIIAVLDESTWNNRDIHNMKIGALQNDYAVSFLEANFSDADIVPLKNLPEGLALLAENEIDGVIGDEPILMYYINRYGYTAKVRLLDEAIYTENMVLAMPKEKAALLPVINDAIQKVNGGQQLEKIQQKWFGISTSLIVDKRYKWIKWLISGILITFVGSSALYYYNQKLRKAVRQRTRQLEQNKNELQLVLQQIPEKVLLLDEQGHIINNTYSNLQIKELDLSLQEVCFLGANGLCKNEQCSKIEPEHIDTCILHKLLTDGHIAEKRFTKGNSVYQLTMVKAMINEPEDKYEFLATIRDVTLDEINRKKLLQTSKMAAIGQLAAGMAHQIRNPLGVIRTQNFLLRTAKTKENFERSLNYIDESAQKISDTIENVLNYWRISGDSVETIELQSFLRALVGVYDAEIKKQNISVVIACEEDFQIRTIRETLNHILSNLISNSIDAMPDGGELILSAAQSKQWISIKCTDTGCGMDKEKKENIFNPFFTTKEPGKGTGLGLFIVYSECEKLGGRVEVESEPQVGTTFTIVIPKQMQGRSST